jgi:hypothetical protein
MLAMNDWWREYLPNAPLLPAPSRPSALSDVEGSERGRARSLARRVAEAVLDLPPFDALERWVYARKGAELRAQSGAAEVTFDETMCKGHFDRWQERTQQRLRERLRQVLEGAP